MTHSTNMRSLWGICPKKLKTVENALQQLNDTAREKRKGAPLNAKTSEGLNHAKHVHTDETKPLIGSVSGADPLPAWMCANI